MRERQSEERAERVEGGTEREFDSLRERGSEPRETSSREIPESSGRGHVAQ